VNIPEEFKRIGYSGQFTIEAVISDATPAVLTEWESKVPCLLPQDGWIALSINRNARTIVLVRRDTAAIVDIATKRTA
jgi:hypothetical protein